MKRLMQVQISPEILLDFIRMPNEGLVHGDRCITTSNGVPNEARPVRSFVDERGIIHLVLESPAFAEVQEGSPIPDLQVVFEVQYDRA